MNRSTAPASLRVKVPKGSRVIVSVPALTGRNLVPSSPGEMDRMAVRESRRATARKSFGR